MQKSRFVHFEFIILTAALMSIVAIALDALLPALHIIGRDIGTSDPSQNQMLILMIFLGLGIGPLVFGPLSDSFGRRPIVFFGFALFILASLLCIFSKSYELMLLGRFLQGVGLSSPRTIAISMIRDKFDGDYMARIMSFITVVFILVPMVAPAFGQFILVHYNWQAIFYAQIIFAILVSFWFFKKQPETLRPENRIQFSKNLLLDGFRELIQYKNTIGYTLISGFITGSFMVYLSASHQIFYDQYHLDEQFPYIFAGLAVAIGAATFLNGTLVLRLGMNNLVNMALVAFFLFSLVYVIIFFNSAVNPDIEVILFFFFLQFFAIGFLFGNLRALAMEPVGHIAGNAAALTGFVSTIMAVPISSFIGSYVRDTALPLFIGFAICGGISIMILIYLLKSTPHNKPMHSR